MSSIRGSATVAGQDIFTPSATPTADLGAKIEDSQGRVLRYIKAGEEIIRGKCVVAPAYVANHIGRDVNTASIGDETVTVSIGGTVLTAGQYDGGFLGIVDDDGEGITYEIDTVEASSGGSEDVVVKLKDPIKVAFNANTTVDLHPSLYNECVDSTAITDTAVGIAPNTFASGYFGWVVSHGIVSALANATLNASVQLTPGTGGGVDEFDDVSDPIAAQHIGNAREDGVSGEHPLIYVDID